MKQIVWHYTYDNITDILQSRALLPPRLIPNLQETPHNAYGERGYEADKKMLLFSANQEWEPASYRGYKTPNGTITDLLKVEDYARVGIQIYRIGVDRSILKPWARLKRFARMPKPMAQSLEDIARQVGSDPYDWWGTLFPVPSGKWEAAQVLVDRDWRTAPAETTPVAGIYK